jgi:cell division protein FtsW (lipid II flippase)
MLLRAPTSWPTAAVAAVAMLLLAAVDLAGAYVAKEAVVRRSLPWAVAGIALFVLLFYVYASSLQYAELALVTLGWVVVLQVGVLVLDHVRYGNALSADKWVAVAVILAAQAYLLLASSESTSVPAG